MPKGIKQAIAKPVVHNVVAQLTSSPGVPQKCKERVQNSVQRRAYEKKAYIIMSMVDKFASQPISDALIDELADLLYEAVIKSSNSCEDIRRIVGDFLEGYRIPYRILCNDELQKSLELGLAWLHTFTFLAVTQNSVWHPTRSATSLVTIDETF